MPGLKNSCLTCVVRGPHCFCHLSAEALAELQDIGTSLDLGPRELVVHEGSVADRVYVICHGRVKLTVSSAEGRVLIVRVAGPGNVLGLASALKGHKHTASAETLEPCRLKSVGRTEFLAFMQRFSEVSRNSATSVADDYEGAMLSARRLALSNSAAGKLASALLEWGALEPERAGPDSPISFRMPLTHEELGSLAGLSRETVTRLLTRFRHDGLIEQRGEWMILHQPAAIEARYC